MYNSRLRTGTISLLMSFVLFLTSVFPFIGGGKALAEPMPLDPGFTGAATFTDYVTASSNPLLALTFDSDNMYVTEFVYGAPDYTSKLLKVDSNLTVTPLAYGIPGKPSGITRAVYNSSDVFYVSDEAHNTIWRGDGVSNPWVALPSPSGADSLNMPAGLITVGDAVYVAGRASGKLHRFDTVNEVWTTVGDGEFQQPTGIAIDQEDNLYVVDYAANKVKKLPYGSGTWQDALILPHPVAIKRDYSGSLYVHYENGFKRLKVGESDWTDVLTTNNPGPGDIALDYEGYLYATDITANQTKVVRLSNVVVYNGNGSTGGSVPTDAGSYKVGVSVSVYGNVNSLTKTGYDFGGWNTAADGSGTTYAAGETFEISKTTTLYAKWLPQYTIALDSSSYSLTLNRTHQSVVTLVYSDNTRQTVTSGVYFTSDNSGIASVDSSSGLVTAKGLGQTVITATYQGKQATSTVTVRTEDSTYSGGGPGGSSPSNNGIEIIIDGVKQDQLATGKTETINGQKVTTIQVDSDKVLAKLEKENNKLLTIPVSGSSDVVIGQLKGHLVKALESKEAVVQIVTDKATYTVPASEINIGSVSAQVGTNVDLKDITINVKILTTAAETTKVVQTAAGAEKVLVLVQPLDFEITATSGDKTVTINTFKSYVERTISLPSDVDGSKITTGVVLRPDGTLYHMPTVVTQEGGKYYAKVNSLTNSTYTIIANERTFADIVGHWSQAEVNDMSDRLVIQGVSDTEFRPDATITRAEFAAIVVRGLGIQPAASAKQFSDVSDSDWYAGVVQAAVNFKLINGYEDGTFRPNQSITRQEAMTVLARTLSIAKLNDKLSDAEVKQQLAAFTDGEAVADWAKLGVAATVSHKLVNGRDGKLDFTANLTRAETAAIVRRLLQEAGLINK